MGCCLSEEHNGKNFTERNEKILLEEILIMHSTEGNFWQELIKKIFWFCQGIYYKTEHQMFINLPQPDEREKVRETYTKMKTDPELEFWIGNGLLFLV